MRNGKPSHTAYKVALDILALGCKPEMEGVLPSGIVDATEQLLISSGAGNKAIVRLHRVPRMISIYKFIELMLPGQRKAFGHRKAYCEQHVREGIASGAKQVLVLGAGYDTMCWRLGSEFSDVTFFEIDHPATASLKAKGIKEMGHHDNLHLIAENLGERKLGDILKSHGCWDVDAPTVIIAEGLLMYLSCSAVHELFSECASACGASSKIVFSYIEKRKGGGHDGGRWSSFLLLILKVYGEPWLWSTEPEHIGQLLNENGWTYCPESAGGANKRGVEFFGAANK